MNVTSTIDITHDPRLELDEVDSEIKRAQAVLKQLLEKRVAVKRRINSRYSPILQLPVEILSEIFMTCYPANSRGLWVSKAPLLLGSICGAWRVVAWSTPQLWCTISLDTCDTGYSMDKFILFCDWLSRTREQPLSLALQHSIPFPRRSYSSDSSVDQAIWEALNLVVQCSKRWENADLYMGQSFEDAGCFLPEEFPLLKTIHLRLKPDEVKVFHSASRLRQVCLRSSRNLVAAALNLPQNKNMRLILEEGTTCDCLDILRYRPNLVHFGIETISLPRIPYLFEPATAPLLQSLEIGHLITGSGQGTYDSLALILIANLTTPALRSLSIFCGKDDWNKLTDFIWRSKCSLTELSIACTSIKPAECLAATPALTKLHLSVREMITEDWMELAIERTPDAASADPILVPNLTHLTYTYADDDPFDCVGLARMLASRRQPFVLDTEPFSRLVEFNLIYFGSYPHPSFTSEDNILEESIDLRMGNREV